MRLHWQAWQVLRKQHHRLDMLFQQALPPDARTRTRRHNPHYSASLRRVTAMPTTPTSGCACASLAPLRRMRFLRGKAIDGTAMVWAVACVGLQLCRLHTRHVDQRMRTLLRRWTGTARRTRRFVKVRPDGTYPAMRNALRCAMRNALRCTTRNALRCAMPSAAQRAMPCAAQCAMPSAAQCRALRNAQCPPLRNALRCAMRNALRCAMPCAAQCPPLRCACRALRCACPPLRVFYVPYRRLRAHDPCDYSAAHWHRLVRAEIAPVRTGNGRRSHARSMRAAPSASCAARSARGTQCCARR